jgi:hypothetical protein
LLCGDCGGVADYVQHGARLGEHRNGAALHLDGRGAHALGAEPLQLRMDCAILGAHDVPARPPGDAIKILGEEISRRREAGRIDDALLFGRQSPGEARDASDRFQPTRPSATVNVLEDAERAEVLIHFPARPSHAEGNNCLCLALTLREREAVQS